MRLDDTGAPLDLSDEREMDAQDAAATAEDAASTAKLTTHDDGADGPRSTHTYAYHCPTCGVGYHYPDEATRPCPGCRAPLVRGDAPPKPKRAPRQRKPRRTPEATVGAPTCAECPAGLERPCGHTPGGTDCDANICACIDHGAEQRERPAAVAALVRQRAGVPTHTLHGTGALLIQVEMTDDATTITEETRSTGRIITVTGGRVVICGLGR